MTPSIDAVFQAAPSLPAENRAVLAEKLLESLNEENHREIEVAWAEEAESRIRAYEQGVTKAIPNDEVL